MPREPSDTSHLRGSRAGEPRGPGRLRPGSSFMLWPRTKREQLVMSPQAPQQPRKCPVGGEQSRSYRGASGSRGARHARWSWGALQRKHRAGHGRTEQPPGGTVLPERRGGHRDRRGFGFVCDAFCFKQEKNEREKMRRAIYKTLPRVTSGQRERDCYAVSSAVS